MESPSVPLPVVLRHEKERAALAIALALLMALLALLGVVSMGALLILLPLVIWLTATFLRVEHRRIFGNAVRVSREQLPQVAEQGARAAAVLEAPPFEIMVVENRQANAYAFGWWHPQAVVLTSGLVEMFSPDELRFVIGHEVGHILLGHTRITSLLGGMVGVPGIPVLSVIGGWAFRRWSRLAEYSADRAGLMAAASLEAAERALTKLMVGPRLASQLNMEKVLDQRTELDGEWTGDMGEALMTHPYLVRRLAALQAFWQAHEEEIRARAASRAAVPLQPGPRFGFGEVQQQDPLTRWLERARPALTAAARWSALYIVLSAVALLTGWASLAVTLFLQALLGLIAAWQAARQSCRRGDGRGEALLQAVGAAWLLLGGATGLILLAAVVAGAESAGVLIPLMVPYLVSLPGIWLLSTLGAGLAGVVAFSVPCKTEDGGEK